MVFASVGREGWKGLKKAVFGEGWRENKAVTNTWDNAGVATGEAGGSTRSRWI
jgi:hypothetical protein